MMIEQNTNYAYKLKYMDNPTFDKVRDLSTKFYRELPQALQDELFEALNRGIDILDSEPQMTAYLFAYGKMHKAKLNYAFEHLPESFFEIPELNIIDYGCGQAVATICYADFLRKRGYEQKIRRVTLIEPSEAALKRAALHVSVFFPDAEIVTINKEFDDLETKDIVCDEDVPTLHLLSNVLDLECFSLIAFKKLVKKRIGPSNLFVCVGPYFGDKDRGKRLDSFAKYFKGEEIFSEDLGASEWDANNSWTCMVRCFGVGDLDYSISDENLSTEVTDEDIENGIKDEYGVIYSKDGKRLLGTKCFDCETYTIKKGVKVICDEAFDWCKSLQSIVIPNSVTSIGKEAFRVCDSLQSIVVPNSVTNIGDSAFWGCTFLQSISIPNSVTSIGDCAFMCCDSLQSIVIPNSVTSIGNEAFGCSSLQAIIIPDSVTNIEHWTFSSCKSLQSIVIPNSVTNIGDYAFMGCDSLQSIVIPDSVTSIGNSAFKDCKSLKSIVIPDSVTSIGNSAFKDCKSLKSIVIQDSVTSIGEFAFCHCESLQ
ncbi:MAG: leucine-rich repeat domain-containing protein, partial [Bacteroidales bacterium]|nr:leucine-rich repeat domain-containing protein [Bacteroidales bacterium]